MKHWPRSLLCGWSANRWLLLEELWLLLEELSTLETGESEQILGVCEQNVCNYAQLWDGLQRLREVAHSLPLQTTAQESGSSSSWGNKKPHKLSKFIGNTKAGFKLWSLRREASVKPTGEQTSPSCIFWGPSPLQEIWGFGTAGKKNKMLVWQGA